MPVLTTAQGGPISDDQNSLKVGPRGPTLIEDFHFREKIFHFDHERIPERVVHARGYGAHGFFENYKSLSKYTRADLFQRAGEKTPAFVRFSTVAGSKGSFDLARDVRGFAVKLYTQEGNWDIVGNNIPVFFIQDAIKFPDMIHAVKEEPDSAFPQAQSAHDNFWDFISLTPESMHMIMWVMSDRAIPRSFRFMEGFGVHTFRLVNAKDESTFVKFHWKPKLGLQSVLWNEAVKINGADPDFHRRDLWTAIQDRQLSGMGAAVSTVRSGVRRQLRVRCARSDQAHSGRTAAADPGRPSGAGSHARQFLCRDRAGRVHDAERAARHRLLQRSAAAGPQLLLSRYPAEAARQPELHPYSDQCAEMPVRTFPAGRPYGDAQSGRARQLPAELVRRRARANPRSAASRRSPTSSKAQSAGCAPKASPTTTARRGSSSSARPGRAEAHRRRADLRTEQGQDAGDPRADGLASAQYRRDAGQQGRARLGLQGCPSQPTPPADAAGSRSLPALSIVENGPQRFEGRKLGILVTDGTDAALLKALKSALDKAGATFEIIAPKVGGVKASDGSWIEADQMIDGGPSVLYDAVALLPAAAAMDDLLQESTARDFVADAFAHCKFIGYVEAAVPLFEKAGIAAEDFDEGCIAMANAKDAKVVQRLALRSCGSGGRNPT